MQTQLRENYISRAAWFRAVVGGEDLILRGKSVLEYWAYFSGYANDNEIDVYAKSKGPFENINYFVVDSFDEIDYVRDGDVLCSTINQAINDMLSDENSDEVVLAEALSDHYHLNGESFTELNIKSENMRRFEEMKDWTMEYYDE